ncbi:hypothetical protein B0T13DRAFT_300750 [Neurospora crassa]|nr:hypothetical protein B0T13DRAFT_300750 [Neurospora crassa]
MVSRHAITIPPFKFTSGYSPRYYTQYYTFFDHTSHVDSENLKLVCSQALFFRSILSFTPLPREQDNTAKTADTGSLVVLMFLSAVILQEGEVFPRICVGSTLTLAPTPHTMQANAERMPESSMQRQCKDPYFNVWFDNQLHTTMEEKKETKLRLHPNPPSELPPLLYTGLLSSVIFFTGLPNYVHIINFFAVKATAMRAENPGLIRSVIETE